MWGGCLTRRGEGTQRRPSTVGSSIGRRQHRLATELENNMYSKGECVCVWDEVLLAKIRESSWFFGLLCLLVGGWIKVFCVVCVLFSFTIRCPSVGKSLRSGVIISTDYKREHTPCRLCSVKIVLRYVCLLVLKERSHVECVT